MIDTTLFPNPQGNGEPLRALRDIAAPVERVWALFTTPAGWRDFNDCEARIDLRVGGAFEILFFPADRAPEGLRGSEGCQILAFDPPRMLTFTWNAPPKFPHARAQRAWVVVYFTAQEGGTRVEVVHHGFGGEGEWPEVREYFKPAWPAVLAELAAAAERPPG